MKWIWILLAGSLCMSPAWWNSKHCHDLTNRPDVAEAIVSCTFDGGGDSCVDVEIDDHYCPY